MYVQKLHILFIVIDGMRWQRKDYLKNVIILVLILFLLLTKYHTNNILQNMDSDRREDFRAYFETDESFEQRLELERKILFGSHIKYVGKTVFTEREGYNESFLDTLPIFRDNITDFRPSMCKNKTFKGSKIKVSVIINYHNELLSLVLRSVYTVINAIPPQNFHELILIDDASNLTTFHDLLEVETLVKSLSVNTRFYRFETNKGLIYCRRFGCQEATGNAVLVLDSHVEVKSGFLAPLLDVIESNKMAIAAPVFDFWDTFNNMHYSYDNHALAYNKYFAWIFRFNHTNGGNFPTPAILGGAFVARKELLEKLDYFGRCMVGWGHENMELTMKTWMCGGEVLYVPCSRVLHYAAKRSPMKHGDRVQANHPSRNSAIIAKSFYPEEYYKDFEKQLRTDKHILECSEAIEINKNILKKNNCKRDFFWIRRNLMPEVESFDGETLVAINLTTNGSCVFLLNNPNRQVVHLNKCHNERSDLDTMRLTKWGEIRMYDRLCLDLGYKDRLGFGNCHRQKGAQLIRYDYSTGRITNEQGNICLVQKRGTVTIEKDFCRSDRMRPESIILKFEFQKVFNKSLLVGGLELYDL